MPKKKKKLNKRTSICVNKCWAFVLRSILPIILSALCALGMIFLVEHTPKLKTWFGLIADATPEWFIKAFYNTVNSRNDRPEPYQDIIFLDLNDKISRSHIADLLTIVVQGKPKVIGVDCTFSTSETYDKEKTNYLVQTIDSLQRNNSTPIVFACSIGEKSAIPDSVILHKGFVNFSGFYDYKMFINRTPHIAISMVQLMGVDISKMNMTSFKINYRHKEFESYYITRNFLQYDVDSILHKVNNKIVIIGGNNNRFDIHQAPFVIDFVNGQENSHIAGSRLIGYALTSIMSASSENDLTSATLHSKFYHHYSACTWWMNALLTILFMMIYFLFYWILNKLTVKYIWLKWLVPILLFTIMILIMFISIWINAIFYVVPYITFYMVSTAFFGFFYDRCKQLINVCTD